MLSPRFEVLRERRRRDALAYHLKMAGWEPSRFSWIGKFVRFEDDAGHVAEYAPTASGWIGIGVLPESLHGAVEEWQRFALFVADARAKLNKAQSDVAYALLDAGLTTRQAGAILGISAARVAKIAPQGKRGAT